MNNKSTNSKTIPSFLLWHSCTQRHLIRIRCGTVEKSRVIFGHTKRRSTRHCSLVLPVPSQPCTFFRPYRWLSCPLTWLADQPRPLKPEKKRVFLTEGSSLYPFSNFSRGSQRVTTAMCARKTPSAGKALGKCVKKFSLLQQRKCK